jgi:hypothetical protein
VRLARTILSGVAARELVLDAVDGIRQDSLDPYVTIRTSFGLLRESAIQNGPAAVEDLPEFEDIDDSTAMETGDGDVTADNTQQVGAIQNGGAAVALAETSDTPTSKKQQRRSGDKQ